MTPIPIARPFFGVEEREAVLEVLEQRVAKGDRVEAFERAFAERHGARFGVATNSGTTALVAALSAVGVGPGDEVIVPAFSFFATAAAVVAVGARPVFADIDPDTFTLCPERAEAAVGPNTKAIMPVHLYGLPADMARLEALCARRGLSLVEDAAQAHGASFAGRPVGSFGTAAFSFYATKNISTAEGGMVLTNDAAVARRARMLRNHGRDGGLAHEIIGSNYRMSELSAAIGCVQLGRLTAWNRARAENARYLSSLLRGVVTPHEPADRVHVFHQYTVRVDAKRRDAVVRALNEKGVGARVYYSRPMYREPALARGEAFPYLPETERACSEVFSLPIHPTLTEGERARVLETVNSLPADLW